MAARSDTTSGALEVFFHYMKLLYMSDRLYADDEDQESRENSEREHQSHHRTPGLCIKRCSFVKNAVAIRRISALNAILSMKADADDPSSMPFRNGNPEKRSEQHRWSPLVEGISDWFEMEAAMIQTIADAGSDKDGVC